MKKLWIVVFLIVGFLGCGSDSSVTVGEEEKVEVENILTKEFGNRFWSSELINHKKYFKVMTKEEDFNIFMNEINTRLDDENISKPFIDFKKYNILVYATKYNAPNELDKYEEEIVIEDDNSIEIEQKLVAITKDEYCNLAIQVRAYKLSKSVKALKIIHEDEVSYVDMDNPHPINEKMINIFTGLETITEYKLITVRVLEQSSIYPNIDFDKYRLLLVNRPIFFTETMHMFEEIITFLDNSTVELGLDFINSKIFKGNCIRGVNNITPKPTLNHVYKVSREITTVKVEDNIVVDMESGEVN